MVKRTKKFYFPTEEEDDLYLEESENFEDESNEFLVSNAQSAFTPDYQQKSNIREAKEQSETKIFKPQAFADAKEIMQKMIQSHSAIVDISDLISSDLGQREAEKIICYLCGVSDAVGFEVKKINISTFFFQSR